MPFFSIIMPVTLADYPKAASNREAKLIRAIDSVINQTCDDWELVIICDGCQKSFDLIHDKYSNHNIILCHVKKQIIWGGIRNIGIGYANGKYVLYLDSDDYFLPQYLEQLKHEIRQSTDSEWFFVDDQTYHSAENVKRRNVYLKHGFCGTQNIIHKRTVKAQWPTNAGYSMDDWGFIKSLCKVQAKPVYLKTSGNVVAHIPGKYDY